MATASAFPLPEAAELGQVRIAWLAFSGRLRKPCQVAAPGGFWTGDSRSDAARVGFLASSSLSGTQPPSGSARGWARETALLFSGLRVIPIQ